MNLRLSKILILSLAIIFLSKISTAQGFLKTEGKKIVNGNNEEVLLRGMGLGGWMLQEGYMMHTSGFTGTQHALKDSIADLIGQSGMEAFYDAWLTNYITERDVDSLKAWGFNSIRLPMHYNLYTLPIEDEPILGEQTWIQKGFDLTDNLLTWCEKNEMYLILDLHAAPGGQGYAEEISDYDPSKPSLWESEDNRDKTVALWKKLAERYANEEWIGGYDLINETNWYTDMDNNDLLKNLHVEITNAIRTVDNNHIIFIEGNGFANDFNGLTPPWDDNMVYSFHKYWNANDASAFDWIIDQMDEYNIPLWLGESGENSNTWFNECISLSEEKNIGWAWWTFKRIESITCPVSPIRTPEYNTLLDYWNPDVNVTKPTIQFATDALMQIAENLKIENCEYHPDLIDAMFRQVYSDETKPYAMNNIPGIIYAPNFDMGKNNIAYYDTEAANYQHSTGNYISWNAGWFYRNDGVDIENSEDLTNSNAYNVGFLEDNEWMSYTVNIAKTAVYNINVRTASANSDGSFYFQEDGVDICNPVSVNNSGGWQDWQTTTVTNVILSAGTHKIKFVVATGGFNLGSYEFIEVGETMDLAAQFISATTLEDGYTIKLSSNKPLSASFPNNPVNDFTVSINGTEVELTNVEKDPSNSKLINITISYLMKAGNNILLSYSGNQINADDGSNFSTFTDKKVINNLAYRHQVPGKIQAEDFFVNSGFVIANTEDDGGGFNLEYARNGDYADYYISVDEAGTYNVSYRVATLQSSGKLELQLVGDEITSLHVVDIPNTGGWQTWQTINADLTLPAGQHILRVLVNQQEFNLNWFEFSIGTRVRSIEKNSNKFQVYPNPAKGNIYIKSDNYSNELLEYTIINSAGQFITSGKIRANQALDISSFKNGIYYVNINENKKIYTCKLIVNH